MLQFLHALGAAQQAQAASLGDGAKTSVPEAALEAYWARNLTLDGLFYDVKALTSEEAARLGDQTKVPEGAILVVPPEGDIEICRSIEEFAAVDRSGVRALAVAGVGSSALGAAALARNVATATGGPVAAIVSGYGYADLATEALGGWFWFGTINRLRHGFEVLDRLLAPPPGTFALEAAVRKTEPSTPLSKYSLDTYTVLQLLGDPQFGFDLLVGHSKGNLVISEALYALDLARPERLAELGAAARIVTISARIAMPRACKSVVDVMGAADGFGELNSTLGICTDIPVPGAGHHTNTDLPGHIDVADVVRQALAA